MRLIFGLVLVIGMGLAGFAVYIAQGQFSKYQNIVDKQSLALSKNVALKTVFVSERRLKYGSRLRKEDVRLVAWPENAIPEGAFISEEDLFGDDDELLRTVLRIVEKDEAILISKVTKPGEDAGVSSRLSIGMRAFALKVDVASGVSGFLRPGDHVDVYWTGKNQGGPVTRLIQNGVKLIAVDQIADEDRNKPTIARTITVEITPQQVAALAQAQSTGRLSLSLRGATDDGVTATFEIDQNTLLGIEDKAPEIVKKEKVCKIKTRKGADVVEIIIPCQ
ncbi:MAG: pilus assembly protein CpaB [Planctomycetota bacterium]|jgi:pilus assembly protein CpaB